MSRQSAFFTIVIPTLNEAVCLPQLLTDLTQQTFTDFAVILVDAQSQDQTITQAKRFSSQLQLTILTSKLKNVSAQRNQGGLRAHSDWIIFMDADNRLGPNFLADLHQQLTAAATAHSPPIAGFTTLIHLGDEDASQIQFRLFAFFLNQLFLLARLVRLPAAFGAMIGVRSSVFAHIKFNHQTKVGEDNVFVRAVQRSGHRYQILRQPTYAYSMRRLKTHGFWRTVYSGVKLNFFYIIGSDLSHSDFGYTMEGGQMYQPKPPKPQKTSKKPTRKNT